MERLRYGVFLPAILTVVVSLVMLVAFVTLTIPEFLGVEHGNSGTITSNDIHHGSADILPKTKYGCEDALIRFVIYKQHLIHQPQLSLEQAERLAYIESRCNPQVKSEKGAIGLYQVMLPTARALYNDKSITENDLFDPEFNTATAFLYLNELCVQHKIEDALTVYNWGYGRFVDGIVTRAFAKAVLYGRF